MSSSLSKSDKFFVEEITKKHKHQALAYGSTRFGLKDTNLRL